MDRKDSEVRADDLPQDFAPLILSCMMKDGKFLPSCRRIISEDCFVVPAHRRVAEVILGLYDDYGEPPDVGVVRDAVRSSYRSNPGSDDAKTRNAVLSLLEEVGDVDSNGWVKDRVIKWAKWTRISQVMGACASYDDPDDFMADLREASSVVDEGSEFTRASQARVVTEEENPPVPSPWQWLNHRLMGGPRLQDFCVVLSFINVGKTTTMINIARHAAAYGHKVVYFTFEDGERKIRSRMMQSICGMTRQEMLVDRDRAESMNRRFFEKTGGEVFIRDLAINRHGVSDAADMIKSLEDSTGEKVDVAVTDYADMFRPSRSRKDSWQEYHETYNACKEMARDLNLLHWTASQVGRDREGKEIIMMGNVSGSIGKMTSPDLVLGFGQSMEDQRVNIINMYTAKVRDAKKAELKKLEVDFERQRIFDPEENKSWSRSRRLGALRRGTS